MQYYEGPPIECNLTTCCLEPISKCLSCLKKKEEDEVKKEDTKEGEKSQDISVNGEGFSGHIDLT